MLRVPTRVVTAGMARAAPRHTPVPMPLPCLFIVKKCSATFFWQNNDLLSVVTATTALLALQWIISDDYALSGVGLVGFRLPQGCVWLGACVALFVGRRKMQSHGFIILFSVSMLDIKQWDI